MDYKELIEISKKAYAEWDGTHEYYQAATLIASLCDAIETLLAERDALMKDAIRCETCLHVKECYFNELRRIDCAQSNRGHWQWRGPQKEGEENG